jgi:hypothetical protein
MRIYSLVYCISPRSHFGLLVLLLLGLDYKSIERATESQLVALATLLCPTIYEANIARIGLQDSDLVMIRFINVHLLPAIEQILLWVIENAWDCLDKQAQYRLCADSSEIQLLYKYPRKAYTLPLPEAKLITSNSYGASDTNIFTMYLFSDKLKFSTEAHLASKAARQLSASREADVRDYKRRYS